ncbi:peptidoglycan DD-metalloendopeptidase family protein [Virgibacillus chiguensis]|uniref:Putative peptidoglycan binding domain-containing protein n=1 Tax=Virgibacillus chiguensis TaxID=411959 RepID=A0A1M5SMN2_9BACI|nr:peptidoglycan DD-metalloendopeptidase family protein [Virgibacillus chiguensis]SHH39710.1 Putative peptidoglycan binding domain-containing protein [Virgibacillus chiguensis]
MKKITKLLLTVALILILIPVSPTYKVNAASNFIWPVEGSYTITRGLSSFHNGLDIAKGGTVPIKASAPGKVIYAKYHSSNTAGDYGNLVAIRHSIGGVTYITKYAHMRSSLKVSAGQNISQGTVLGYMGNTGDSTGQHLHFEILKGTTNMWASRSHRVDPLDYLGKSNNSIPKPDLDDWSDFPTIGHKNYSGREAYVELLQGMLHGSGYSSVVGSITGKYNSDTKKAVIHFQRDHGLRTDGVVGKKTWQKFDDYIDRRSSYRVNWNHPARPYEIVFFSTSEKVEWKFWYTDTKQWGNEKFTFWVD